MPCIDSGPFHESSDLKILIMALRFIRRVLQACVLPAALLMALGAATGCGKAKLNILLISIDTLRADHLGCYGYERPTSPVIDRLADRSIRFTEAIAPSPWTLPSHAAMLTGRHPVDVGIADYASIMRADVPTLAEVLQEAGYGTAAFVDSRKKGFVGPDRGFDRGFDTFRLAPHVPVPSIDDDMAGTVDAALNWLDNRPAEAPFFLFLHTKSVHNVYTGKRSRYQGDAPYFKPEPFQSRYLSGKEKRFTWQEDKTIRGGRYLARLNEQIGEGALDPADYPAERLEELIAFYDGGIAYTDLHLGRLLEGLKQRNLDSETLIVVTSDHGEAFLDHHQFLHQEVYRPLLRVPLLYHDPRMPRSGVCDNEVLLEDIMPTLLSAVGVAGPQGMSGRILPLDNGPPARRKRFSYYRFQPTDDFEALGLREWPFKLVCFRYKGKSDYTTELYRLDLDPKERSPLEGEAKVRQAMKEELLRWSEAKLVPTQEKLPMSRKDIQDLRALGYLK
jgi:arylsulfatase A-like enzyme